MKKIFLGILVLLTVIFLVRVADSTKPKINSVAENSKATSVTGEPTIIADKLKIPWSLVFLPDKSILFTERSGNVRIINSSGILAETPVAIINDVKAVGEGGLLGIEVHPDFIKNHFVYVYYTYASEGDKTKNKVARFVYDKDMFSFDKEILTNIPGNSNHNGGRLKFGPDGYLYITTGDSQEPSLSQDKSSLAGKILRVTDDGKAVVDNPFNNFTYSYGHRNPQGLAWDEEGRLWSAEHGPSAGDEINLIEKGKNYGWPDITRSQVRSGMETSKLNSEKETWAPSGLVYTNNLLYFAGLRSRTLFRLDTASMKLDQFLQGKYGRIRDVVVGPEGFLYITTSNMDGRSVTNLDGDKIIRLDPKLL